MDTDNVEGFEKLNADLVIIGSGGAGMPAAAAAVENGVKDIIVLEKDAVVGGNGRFAAGIFGAETTPQRRLGIDAKKDDLFRMHMDWTHWRVNPRIVRAFIDKSSETIEWLEDKGVKLHYIPRIHTNHLYPTMHQPDPHGDTSAFGRGAGFYIIKTLQKECEDHGVKILCNTTAKKILLDQDGNVAGLIVETKEGKQEIRTKAIIIATSSPAGPEMAKEVGATGEEGGQRTASGPEFRTSRGDPRKIATQVGAMARQPHTLWVNKRGERFVNENLPLEQLSGNALQRQPEGICYSLFDEKIVRIIHETGTVKSGIMAPPGDKLPNLESDLKSEVAGGVVKISDSWDEIAEWIGVPPETLKETIDEYNAYCDSGRDPFVKDLRYLIPLRTAPFYVTKCSVMIGWPIGGIKINHKMEVLNSEDNPIKGLYAAGNDCGSWQYDTYNMELAAAALGFAVNSGRIAAENIAKYLSE